MRLDGFELRLRDQAGERCAHVEAGLRPRFEITARFEPQVSLQGGGNADALLPAQVAQGRYAIARTQRSSGHLVSQRFGDANIQRGGGCSGCHGRIVTDSSIENCTDSTYAQLILYTRQAGAITSEHVFLPISSGGRVHGRAAPRESTGSVSGFLGNRRR